MTIHFQTCFYIHRNSLSAKRDFLGELQEILLSWISWKESIDNQDAILRTFRLKMNRILPSGARCVTYPYIYHDENGSKCVQAWALRYVHKDTQYDKIREWITDVGIQTINDNVCLMYTQVAYTKFKHVLTEDKAKNPIPTTPLFIKSIKENDSYRIYFPGNGSKETLPVHKVNFIIESRIDLDILYNHIIESKLRQYAVVILYGPKAYPYVRYLYDELYSKALVFFIKDIRRIEKELNSIPPENPYHIDYNNINIFFPVNSLCPSVSIPIAKFLERPEEVVCNLLSNNPLDDRRAVRSVDHIRHLFLLSQAKKKNSPELVYANAEIELWKEEYDRVTEENRRLQQSNKLFSEKIHRLEKELLLNTGYIGYELAQTVVPNSLTNLLDFFGYLFQDRIIVHDKAYESAKKYAKKSGNNHIEKAWRMLTALVTTLYDMKFVSGSINQTAFSNQTGIELAMAERTQTMNNPTMMEIRNREYNGMTYNIAPHLKYADKSNLRLHFQIIDDEKKILIGHFGAHLETAGTRLI